MASLSASNLKMSFGEDILFSDGSFEIAENESVGLIGANGVGKTTLFRMITGKEDGFEGDIVKGKNTVIGYMEQHACRGSVLTLYGELMTVFDKLTETENELEALSKEIESAKGDLLNELILHQGYLTEKFQSSGGLTYRSRARATLIGLGFSEDDFYIPVSDLSGGQKSKLSLAKLLLSGANFLLLDEPTNHLDIESVEWLEGFLRDFGGASLIISHDRYFLDKVTSKTLEIENKRITLRKGNYSTALKQKELEMLTVKRNYDNTMAEVHRIEGIIAQQKQFNRERNIRTAESKQKMIDRLLDGLVIPDEKQEDFNFKFSTACESGNDVLFISDFKKSFDSKTLFKNVDINIYKGDRMFLLGPNGCGKTTLLKILIGKEKADSGEFKFGSNVKIGYFDQSLSGLDDTKTALDEIWDEHKDFDSTAVRNALATFLFKGDDVYKKIGDLSGGEKARIALLKLMLTGANLLLLDEPTNHLDIRSREALENALSSYTGTILTVSHDRYFINKLSTKIVRFYDDGIKSFDGNYDDYCVSLESERATATVQKKEKNTQNDYKLRKELKSEYRRVQTAIKKCEERIEENENESEKISQMLLNPETAADYEKVSKLTSKMDEIKSEIEALMEEWESLSDRFSYLEEKIIANHGNI